VAVSADTRRWFLLNASPDVHAQIARLPSARANEVRYVPVEGIALTDAELDHTLGIALLREAGALHLYATSSVLGVLDHDSRVLPVTRAFACVDVTILELDGLPAPLRYQDGSTSGLSIQAVEVAGDPPRFASEFVPGHTVALVVHDGATGGTCAFVPGCGALDAALLARLATADLVVLDGTFFTDDELQRHGIGQRTAMQMGHLPIGGPNGTLAAFAGLPCRHKVYSHINNTNLVLLEDSLERQAVERAGILVGRDGMEFQI
jgi:pyrroloquinoline quinone biosynthesis protein B